MGYIKIQIIENDTEREKRIAQPKSTNKLKKEESTKEVLIMQILDKDPSRSSELLENFSEYYLEHVILKRILQQEKRGLLMTKKRLGNPYEKYEKRLEEPEGPIL